MVQKATPNASPPGKLEEENRLLKVPGGSIEHSYSQATPQLWNVAMTVVTFLKLDLDSEHFFAQIQIEALLHHLPNVSTWECDVWLCFSLGILDHEIRTSKEFYTTIHTKY
jgi:hypothetical protein